MGFNPKWWLGTFPTLATSIASILAERLVGVVTGVLGVLGVAAVFRERDEDRDLAGDGDGLCFLLVCLAGDLVRAGDLDLPRLLDRDDERLNLVSAYETQNK